MAVGFTSVLHVVSCSLICRLSGVLLAGLTLVLLGSCSAVRVWSAVLKFLSLVVNMGKGESFQYRVRFVDGYLVEFVTGAVVDAEATAHLLRACEEGFRLGTRVPVAVGSIMKVTWEKGAGHDKAA